MNIRMALVCDLLLAVFRIKHLKRKARAALGHFACKYIGGKKLFQSQCAYPLHAVLLVTTRCNKMCPDCFYTRLVNTEKSKTELSFETIKNAFDTDLFKSVCRVALVGGEPLLYRDLVETIAFLKRQGILVTMTTNGLLLRGELLKSLRTAGLDWLNISIYDDNRVQIAEAFKAAREGTFPINRMALTYHSGEIRGYDQAYQLAVELGAPGLIFNHLYVSGDSRPDSERDAFADEFDILCEKIRKDGLLQLYAHQPFRSTGGGGPQCAQAMGMVSLAPDGTLGPCCHLPPGAAFGSIDNPAALLQFKRNVFEEYCPLACNKCYFLRNGIY